MVRAARPSASQRLPRGIGGGKMFFLEMAGELWDFPATFDYSTRGYIMVYIYTYNTHTHIYIIIYLKCVFALNQPISFGQKILSRSNRWTGRGTSAFSSSLCGLLLTAFHLHLSQNKGCNISILYPRYIPLYSHVVYPHCIPIVLAKMTQMGPKKRHRPAQL
jgi:hypothetical protein